MRNWTLSLLLAAGLAAAASPSTLAQGSAFSYQGKLELNGEFVNGLTDIKVDLYTLAEGSLPIGSVTMDDHPVVDGLFVATLDYGVNVFLGGPRWLQFEVRPGSSDGPYTVLNPRQPIRSAPYAIFAGGATGENITFPVLMPQSSAGSVGYGFDFDGNTGLFSPGDNQLGLATGGFTRLFIDHQGDVALGKESSLYRLTVRDSNHQIAVEDSEDDSRWTLTTISGGGFGIYQAGSTQRMAIDSDGSVSVEGGKAVVYNHNSTEVMVIRTAATLTATLSANQWVEGTQSWGGQGFSAPPAVYVGSFIGPASELSDYQKFSVTCNSVTTTGCKVRITNISSASASITSGQWSLLVVGPR